MMKIESVASRQDRVGRFKVCFEDGSCMWLYRQTIEDFALYPGQELDDVQCDQLREAAGKMSAKMRAVRIVSATNISKAELERRLVHKGENTQDAKHAVEWLSELEILDDEQSAQQIVHRCISKGYGINRAKQALYEKRIPKKYWDSVLEEYPDQTEAIVSFLRARLGESWDDKQLHRAMDALIRRGHNYMDIRRGLMEISVNEDFLEE